MVYAASDHNYIHSLWQRILGSLRYFPKLCWCLYCHQSFLKLQSCSLLFNFHNVYFLQTKSLNIKLLCCSLTFCLSLTSTTTRYWSQSVHLKVQRSSILECWLLSNKKWWMWWMSSQQQKCNCICTCINVGTLYYLRNLSWELTS